VSGWTALAQRFALAAKVVHFRPHARQQQLRRRHPGARPLQHPDLALLSVDLPTHARDLVADPVQLHGALRSSGTSPKFPDQRGVAEFSGRRIPCPAERDRAGAAWLSREHLGPHDGRIGARAFHGFAGGNAIVGEHKGQGDVVGHVHRNHSVRLRDRSNRPRA
jgi:hypothetical protein